MKMFKRCYIEVTNICNLNCSFCPPTRREKQFMTVDSFRIILEQITGLTKYIYFHVKGEPLLHPQLDQLLDMSYNMGFKVNITTNGLNIQEVKERLFLKPSLRQISFSLQSFENPKDDMKLKEYMNHILEFTKIAAKENGILVELRLWNLLYKQGEVTEEVKNSKILKIIEEELGLGYSLEERINKDMGEKLTNNIYLSQSNLFQWPDLNKEIVSTTGFCYGLRNQFGILVDGTVIPCCLDSDGIINLGNIFEKNIIEILDNERSGKLFNGFSNREVVEPLCQRCGYRLRFGV